MFIYPERCCRSCCWRKLQQRHAEFFVKKEDQQRHNNATFDGKVITLSDVQKVGNEFINNTANVVIR